jgi:MraZ protein
MDKSLALYTEEEFARLAERVKAMSPTRPDVRAFARLFYTAAERVELDGQGRVRISQDLADWATLDKEVVLLLGVQDHVELWCPEVWKAYQQEKRPHYDEIAEAAFVGQAPPR